MDTQHLDAVARSAIITVGHGRGFVLATTPNATLGEAVIITAAHCLPRLPKGFTVGYTHERTYARLLGPLGPAKPTVKAECLFCDPVGDIAVLGVSDKRKFWNEVDTLRSGAVRAGPSEAWLLSLGGRWASCVVEEFGDTLWITQAAEPIEGGMSGSPILDDQGAAIGVLVCSGGDPAAPHTEGGPNPSLLGGLPGWLLRQL